MPRLLYGPWTPDLPEFLSKGVMRAENVYPAPLGYHPVNKWHALTDALPDPCIGAASVVSSAGDAVIIAGTRKELYAVSGSGWTLLAGGFSWDSETRWRFAQFGALCIATNGHDGPVKINLDTLATNPLGGTPPRARVLAVVRDFLVAGVINDDVRTLQWSGINDAEFWTAAQNQSDFQIMPTGGEITGLFGGEFGLILQRGRITRMSYLGGNIIFQFDEISYNIGCVSRHSVAQAGSLGFFLSDNGFIMWTGAELKPIGYGRVDRTFKALYNRANWSRMSTAVDLRNNLVCWSMGDRVFVYNWVLDRWSVINQQASIIFTGFTRAMTLEEVGEIFPDLDTMPISLDDDWFQEGNPAFYVVDDNNRMGAFLAEPMQAVVGLADMEFAEGRESRLSQVRPLTDASTGITLSVESRARLGDVPAGTDYTYLSAAGDMPVRESGRYLRLTKTIAEGTDWTFTEGLDIGIGGGLAAGGRR